MWILARLDRGIRHIQKRSPRTIRTIGLHRRLPKVKQYLWASTICLRHNIKEVFANGVAENRQTSASPSLMCHRKEQSLRFLDSSNTTYIMLALGRFGRTK